MEATDEAILEIHCAYDTLHGFLLSCPDRPARRKLMDQLNLLYEKAYGPLIAVQSAPSSPTGRNTLTSGPVSAAATPTGSRHETGESGETAEVEHRSKGTIKLEDLP